LDPNLTVEEALLEELNFCMGRTERNEFDPKGRPPGEWKVQDVRDLLGGEARSNGMVLLEKRHNDETVTVVSSSEVLVEENALDEEDDPEDVAEMNENGFEPEGRGISGLMLVCISRACRPHPLYFECTFDRFGYEIMRVHVGLGMAGFMMDEDGQSALLYHLYLSHKDKIDGASGNVMPGDRAGDKETPDSAASPPFHTLDLDLQKRFESFLKERTVDDRLMSCLMDEVLARTHHQYYNFLEGMREWVSETPSKAAAPKAASVQKKPTPGPAGPPNPTKNPAAA